MLKAQAVPPCACECTSCMYGVEDCARLLNIAQCAFQKEPVRIVAVASMVHSYGGLDLDDLHFRRRPYGQLKAYSQSKLCNILFAKELARRYPVSLYNSHDISQIAKDWPRRNTI